MTPIIATPWHGGTDNHALYVATPGLLEGWEAAQTVTLVAALIAVVGVGATILTTSARARREHRTDLYASALGGVADYLEGPYRIRRKDGTAAHRNAITTALSDVKSTIDHNQELLRLHAPWGVAEAFDDYVNAAKVEAGRQMSGAWEMPAITSDAEVNLKVPYDRQLSMRYRTHVVKVMQADLSRRWYKPFNLRANTLHTFGRLGPPTSPKPGAIPARHGPPSSPEPEPEPTPGSDPPAAEAT